MRRATGNWLLLLLLIAMFASFSMMFGWGWLSVESLWEFGTILLTFILDLLTFGNLRLIALVVSVVIVLCLAIGLWRIIYIFFFEEPVYGRVIGASRIVRIARKIRVVVEFAASVIASVITAPIRIPVNAFRKKNATAKEAERKAAAWATRKRNAEAKAKTEAKRKAAAWATRKRNAEAKAAAELWRGRAVSLGMWPDSPMEEIETKWKETEAEAEKIRVAKMAADAKKVKRMKMEGERKHNAIQHGIRMTNSELTTLNLGKDEREAQRRSNEMLIPSLIVDAFVNGKCSEDEMLEIWGVMENTESLSGKSMQVCAALIAICGDEKRLPATIDAGADWKENGEGIWKFANAHGKLLEIATDCYSGNQTSREDLEFLLDIGGTGRHPQLLDYVLDSNKGEWTIESAQDLLETKGFDDYPDAVLEVLEGANWKAVAAKRNLLQL